jgi:adenosine kinase
MHIFVSGSLAYDRIMDFPGRFSDHILPDKIHILNVCFTVNGLAEKFGGTAGNIAYNLSLLGEKPEILATAGKDFERYEQWLGRLGLPLSGIRVIPDEFTAGAYITTDKADNQITGFNPGAMKHPSLYGFDGIRGDEAIAIISPGNIEDMLAYSRSLKERGVAYIFDPGQTITALTGAQLTEMMTGAALLISNDYELEMIMKPTGFDRDAILRRAGGVITTLGEKGALLATAAGETRVSAVPAAKVADPTGAGDAFRAGLLKGLVTGRELEAAACMGAVCASFAVECLGTQEHAFTLEDFWGRFQTSFGAGRDTAAARA